MKHIHYILLLSLIIPTLSGCTKQEKGSSINPIETSKESNQFLIGNDMYGHHTDEIQEFLSATPMGSEIYLEQKESGEWYLKIEKTFTVQKDTEETENIEPIYGDSILI